MLSLLFTERQKIMLDKILQEVFGLTDVDAHGNRPGGMTYNRDSTDFDNTHRINNIYDQNLSRINHAPGVRIPCAFLNNDKCGKPSGCSIINVREGSNCPIIEHNRQLWTDCPCYIPEKDLMGRLVGNPNERANETYNFNDPHQNIPLVNRNTVLSSWQHEIFNNIRSRRDNLIISVPPAGGKTRPIKAYFYEKMLNFLNDPIHNDMPRLIYFVPTKQLSIQIRNNDFIRDEDYGLYSLFSNMQSKKDSRNLVAERDNVKNWMENLLYSNNFNSEFEREIFVMKLAESFIVIMSGDNPNPEYKFGPDIVSKLPFLRNQFKPIIICVKSDRLVPTIKTHASHTEHIFVDEVQELLPKPNMPITKDSYDQFIQLCNVIVTARKTNTKIHLMTGSVNEVTLTQLRDAFNKYLNVKFEFIPNINKTTAVTDVESPKFGQQRKLDANTELPGMKNRSNLAVVPLQALSSGDPNPARIKLIKDIVKTRQTNSIMIIFSAKNFTKTSLINLILESIKSLPRRPHDYLYDNTSRIDIPLKLTNNRQYHSSRNIKDTDEYSVSMHGHRKVDIAKIVARRESEKDIRRYSDYESDEIEKSAAELENIKNRKLHIPGFHDKTRIRQDDKVKTQKYVDDIEFLKYFNRFELEIGRQDQDIERMTMTEDKDNLIYQAALCGIGMLIGPMHPIHKDTIQRLFQKGKIYMLLATDALGVNKMAPSNSNI
jgi:hypothetical protein